MYKLRAPLMALFLLGTMTYGQEVKTRAYFSKDTLKVGEQVDFTIISDYPRGIEVLFPDSTYNFSPFEYLEKYYQSTVSDATSSNDSVVYRLTTFSLDSVQKLGLPVFLISDGDSIQVDSNTDSLYLQHVITESIDSLQVKETIGYHAVSKAFNYPYLLIALAGLLVIAILIAVFFGKEIKKRFKLYRLRKAHARFLETFIKLQDRGVQSSNQAETLLGYWKTYLEKLEGLPYTKLTTKEIVTLEQNFEFEETLRGLDSNIYGEYNSSDISRLIAKLKEFGIDRFIKKVEELKHA